MQLRNLPKVTGIRRVEYLNPRQSADVTANKPACSCLLAHDCSGNHRECTSGPVLVSVASHAPSLGPSSCSGRSSLGFGVLLAAFHAPNLSTLMGWWMEAGNHGGTARSHVFHLSDLSLLNKDAS